MGWLILGVDQALSFYRIMKMMNINHLLRNLLHLLTRGWFVVLVECMLKILFQGGSMEHGPSIFSTPCSCTREDNFGIPNGLLYSLSIWSWWHWVEVSRGSPFLQGDTPNHHVFLHGGIHGFQAPIAFEPQCWQRFRILRMMSSQKYLT